jgi:hypothetical protein
VEIGDFLARTRHIRPHFPQEGAYLFTEAAERIISVFCGISSVARQDVVFHPTYTSRASPELIRLHRRWYVVWDYHFAELIHSLSFTTLTLQLLEAGKLDATPSVGRESIDNHLRASVFRFLSCQFFRRPSLSVALSQAFEELAGPLRVPIPRAFAELLAQQRTLQWSYTLWHELAHVYYATRSEEERAGELESVRQRIEVTEAMHRTVHEAANAHPGLLSESAWWAIENDTFVGMMKQFSQDMRGNFDETIGEEFICDGLAFRLTVLHGCTVNGVPFDFNDEGCVALMESARSAVNALNNFRLMLDLSRSYWEGLAKRYSENGLSDSTIAEERSKALSRIQEVFLRGSAGLETAWFGTVASALGRTELPMDDPQLLAHVDKSILQRRTGEGIEGFDEAYTKAWNELLQVALALMDESVVKLIFDIARQTTSERSPETALKKAKAALDW